MYRPELLVARAAVVLAASLPLAVSAQRGPAAQSAPISNIRYDVTFDTALAARRTLAVAMSFDVGSGGPVLLSLPVWTPGAYEVSDFAKWVSHFAVAGGRDGAGGALTWDKLDPDTWRIRPGTAKSMTVRFEFLADSLDNAMAWTQPDFALFNGTNVFLYPEGRPFDFAATVTVHTAAGWRVATGMTPATGATNTFSAATYHDLVDMPFFVGRFDIDSAMISERWTRFASYPIGSVGGPRRAEVWDFLKKIIPQEVAVFGEAPWQTYTVMQIADPSQSGASGLEHQSSHVDVIAPGAIGHPFMPSLYAHEIFHAWNVKRLRPSDLWPYQYDQRQPTPLLWVSEGITDYYADLALVRGGIIDSAGFFALTEGKIQEVADAVPVALEDASLSTWLHPTDGSGYLYYPKGSLAGLMLDVIVRDASDNRRSLDNVFRELYTTAYKAGHGFTDEQWWAALSKASGGRSLDTFHARFVDGRDPFPLDSLLPLAGMRVVKDTIRLPRVGVSTMQDSAGAVRVMQLEPGSPAELVGVHEGDIILSIAGLSLGDPDFATRFQQRFATGTEATVEIRVRRGTETLTFATRPRFVVQVQYRVDADPGAGAKALRIRNGILHGTVDR